jgi:uncharacterized membrane protein YqiK
VNQYLTAILAISSLAFSKGLLAENMSEHEYKTAIKSITAEYDSAITDCGGFANHDKSICLMVAKNQKKAAKAELTAAYTPLNEADYKINLARENNEYAVALQKCEAQSPDCKKIAKDAMQHSKSDADTQLKRMRAVERYNNLIIDTHLNSKWQDE